jgi:aspartate aminotransferase-like enzyme
MEVYENGGHAYHATMPTDALVKFRNAMKETENYGFNKVRAAQWELGKNVRVLLVSKGFRSVAAEGFQAPSVVVSYTDNVDIHNGKKFAELGIQIAAGVPLQCDEPEEFQTFRLGLFGLDKLHNIDRTVDNLAKVLNQIL